MCMKKYMEAKAERTCAVCERTLANIDFTVWRTSKDGMRFYYSRACRDCSKEEQRIVKGLKMLNPRPPRGTPCDCCQRVPLNVAGGFDALWLDHDHTTKRFRGWCCRRCQVGLGHLNDSEAGILMALHYLRRASK